MLSYGMPLGFAYGRSSRRSRLRRRSSIGSMPICARRDVEQHLACQRLELPRPAVRGAPDGVRVDRLGREARARARGTAPGTACRPRPRARPATAWDTRRSRRRSRCARPGSRRRRRTPSARSPCSWRDLPAAEQVLAAVLDPLQRRADLRRREHQAHLVALDHDLLAEAAAGVAHHDADAVLGHPEQARAEQPHFVRRLRRRVDREVAGRRARSRRRSARPSIGTGAYACW